MKRILKAKELKLIDGGNLNKFYKPGDYKGNSLNCVFSLFKKC